MPVTSSLIQTGVSNCSSSLESSISATTNPSLSPRNSSTTHVLPAKGTVYLYLETSDEQNWSSSSIASCLGISYSNSDLAAPTVFPLIVIKPPSSVTRTRIDFSGSIRMYEVYRFLWTVDLLG